MGYSPLVSYIKLSPHHSGRRNHKIDTVTIHHMAGNLSVETCGQVFQTKRASANYGVGSDGRIALYVDEDNRSWASASDANDNRAVTIEVANSAGGPDWPVSPAAMDALVQLLADICRRNGIPRLLWKGDKSLIGQVDKQNMTVHQWFMATACPGPYLMRNMGETARRVNERLAGTGAQSAPSPGQSGGFIPYTVRVTVSNLNIRKGPGTNYPSAGYIKPSVYTITEEVSGKGATKWGKLKSGVGWISLDYATKT